MWVLQVCDSMAEAAYWEACFAAEYGLPTACFHGVGRSLAMDDAWLGRLYRPLDTEHAGQAAPRRPATCTPSSRTTARRTARDARRSNLTMFSDRRAAGRLPPGAVVVEPGRRRRAAAGGGLPVRPGKRRLAALRDDPQGLRRGARRSRSASPTPAGSTSAGGSPRSATIYDFMPLSHLRPGMTVLVETATAARAEASVDDVDVRRLRRPGLRPRGRPTRTPTCANGVLVHNAIYKLPRRRHAEHRRVRGRVPRRHRRCCSSRTTGRRQTILDAANAVIANNLEPQAQGAVDRRRARASAIVRYHADDEADEAQWVAAPDRAAARRRRHALGRHAPSSTAPTPRAASSRSTSCASGIPYKVVGGTRFYDRREVKDALAYLKAVVNPADEVSVKRVLNVPKRGVGDTSRSAASTPTPAATASPSSTPCAEAAERRRHRAGGARASTTFLDAARRRSPLFTDDGPAAVLEAAMRALGLPRRARGRALHRGRGPHREPGRAGRRGPRLRLDRRVPRAGQPGGRHRRARRRRRRRSCS